MKHLKLKEELSRLYPQTKKTVDILIESHIEKNSDPEDKKKWIELKKRYNSGKETQEDGAWLVLRLQDVLSKVEDGRYLEYNGLSPYMKQAITDIATVVHRDMHPDEKSAAEAAPQPTANAPAQSVAPPTYLPPSQPTAQPAPQPAPAPERHKAKKPSRKTRVIIGIILLVICVIELIGVLTGKLTVDEGQDIMAPFIAMMVLFGGGGLFFLLWTDRK